MENKLPASFKMRVRIDFTSVPIPRCQCPLDETYLSWMPNPPAARTNGASMTALILLKMNFKSARQTALTSANPDWFPNKVRSGAMKSAALLNEQKTHPYEQSIARKDVFLPYGVIFPSEKSILRSKIYSIGLTRILK